MNKIVVVGDHYAAETIGGQVVGVVCRSEVSGDKWAFHPLIPDGSKSSVTYVSLQHALDLAKGWAT